MKTTTICQGCWEQMHVPIVIRGPFSIPYRLMGIHKSQMHPNLCTICESSFTKVKKQKQIVIDTTILFADLRGYTHLSQEIDDARINELLHLFYDECSKAVWEMEGIVNKFIGDAVLAVFNFPMVRNNHVQNAVEAAFQLQKRCLNIKKEIGLGEEHSLGVGIGVHTGHCSLGEVGTSYKDFTVIGSVVNIASRIQNAAGSGEILVTDEVLSALNNSITVTEKRVLNLKGIDKAINGYTISQNGTANTMA